MGADASLFLFDFALYRETVAPAFRRLLLDGYVEPWLSDIYRAYLQHYEIASSTHTISEGSVAWICSGIAHALPVRHRPSLCRDGTIPGSLDRFVFLFRST